MPKYRVSLQRNVRPTAKMREQRSHRPVPASLPNGMPTEQAILVDAVSVRSALLKAEIELNREGFASQTRIVGIEEVVGIDQSELTDDMLTKELLGTGRFDEVEDYDGRGIDDYDPDLHSLVREVADALADSGIVPGLTISECQNGEGWVDYLMIEVYDEPSSRYYATGCEPEDVPLDTSAKDWDVVLTIARGLIGIVSYRGLL